MISLSILSEEEKKFIKTNFKIADEISKVYEKIMLYLGDFFLQIKFDNETVSDQKFRVIVYAYLMPLIEEYYRSIIKVLRKGSKMSACVLFRAQLEVYIDFYFLSHRQDLIGRYLDYHHIAAKWYLDSLRRMEDVSDKEEKITSNYNEFKKNYSVMKDSELSTWSGLSIRKMALEIPENGNEIYSFYNRYSAYGHPSSNAMIILGAQEYDVEEDVIHEVFLDAFFMGGYLLFLSLINLSEICKIENSRYYNRLFNKTKELYEEFHNIQESTENWKNTVIAFYKKSEIGF